MTAGVLEAQSEAWIDAVLREMAVEDVWGIGGQRGSFLRRHGIETAYQFKLADSAWVKRHLYLPVARTQLELRGVSCLPLDEVREPKQQIMSSRSFGEPVETLASLKEAPAQYAE